MYGTRGKYERFGRLEHVKENDLNYLKKGLDNVIKHDVQGEKLFEDCQVEHQNLDHLFHDLNRKVFLLEREVSKLN
jgi:hypothetical protein